MAKIMLLKKQYIYTHSTIEFNYQKDCRMLNRVVRSFPKRALRVHSGNVCAVRSFVSTTPRLGNSDDKKSWNSDEMINEEPFPASLSEFGNASSSNDFSSGLTDADGIESALSSAVGRDLVMSDPFDLVCSYINNIHVAWDVPYWHSIMIGTLGLRLVILPVALRTMQNAGRLAVVQPLVKAKVDEANANKDDKELYTKLMLEGRDIYAQHNVNPVLSLLLPFVQMPLFVSFFFGLQRMVEIFPDYTSGGTLWFENLAVADPTYMLPIINGFTFFLVFESNSDLKAKQPQMMIFFRAMALFMIPITATFQSVRYCMRV
jgi:hypothetical protein